MFPISSGREFVNPNVMVDRLFKNAICGHANGVTSSFVTATYTMYALFLRICAPCTPSFLNSL